MSRKRIIIKSIAVCIVLLILYSLGIQYIITTVAGESQWVKNFIAAEEIIYASTTPHTVLVGSSLTNRLKPEMFSGNVFNLSFSGKSVFDGLYILERLNHVPSLVLIETNILTRPHDDSFTDSLFQQPMYALKRYIPALRERHHPLFDLKEVIFETGRFLKKKMRQPLESNKRAGDTATPEKSPVRLDKDVQWSNKNPLFDRIIERQVNNYKSIPSEQRTRDIIKELKQAVDLLLSRGSRVILFEMPMHPLLCDSPMIKHVRAAISATFSNDQYLILPRPNCSEYKTTDGVHLTAPSAVRFAAYLQEQLSVSNFLQLEEIDSKWSVK